MAATRSRPHTGCGAEPHRVPGETDLGDQLLLVEFCTVHIVEQEQAAEDGGPGGVFRELMG